MLFFQHFNKAVNSQLTERILPLSYFLYTVPIDRGTTWHKLKDINSEEDREQRKDMNQAIEKLGESLTLRWTNCMPVHSQRGTLIKDLLKPLEMTELRLGR